MRRAENVNAPSLGGWVLVTAGSAALVVGLLFTNLKGYSTVLRADKELLGSVQPLAPMGGALRYAKMMFKSTQIVVQATGTDARPADQIARGARATRRVAYTERAH